MEEVVELKNNQSLYKETLKWIYDTYGDPNDVLKGNVDGEYLRIDAIIPGKSRRPEIHYSLILEFKESKYRLRLTINNLEAIGLKFRTTFFYKKDGSLRKMNRKGAKWVEEAINNVLGSHYMYLTNDQW